MKKLLCFVMLLAVTLGVFSGCGCEKQEEATATESGHTNERAPGFEVKQPEVSENKKVVTSDKAPEVVIIMGADNGVDNMTYHLKKCKTLKGKTTQDVSWEFVKTVGFWQCPECNPPRYEDYKNAE